MSNDFSKKIYTLRKQQGLTLEQVANVVGVGKSTVRKWETGMIANVKRDKISLIAKALHTTPGYLMGWEEDSNIINVEKNPPEEPKLSEGEKMLLELFRQVPEDQQQLVLGMIRAALSTKG